MSDEIELISDGDGLVMEKIAIRPSVACASRAT